MFIKLRSKQIATEFNEYPASKIYHEADLKWIDIDDLMNIIRNRKRYPLGYTEKMDKIIYRNAMDDLLAELNKLTEGD